MPFFNNKRKDFSIQPPKQSIANGAFTVTDSANIDFTYASDNLSANLTTTGIIAGTYGDATHIPVLTLDIYGRVIGVSTTTFSASGIALEVNGTPNLNQTILNLIDSATIQVVDLGGGDIEFNYIGTGGSGTVTSVSASTGMSFTTITTSGSVAIDTTKVPYIPAGFTTGLLKWDGSNWVFDNSTYLTSAVTSVGTGTGLTGGTITSTGSISLNTKLAPADNLTGNALKYLRVNAGETAVEYATASSSGGILHGTTSGTDTYTVTITGATAYADGDAYLIRFAIGNTTSATLNINGQGAIPLYRNNDGPLLGGDVIAGGEMICVYNSTLTIFQCIGISPNSLIAYVTNDDSVTITKGQVVYAFGGVGDRMTVKLANNVGDATSAQTVGLVLSTSIAANQKGLIMMQGLLDGLDIVKPINGWLDGDPVYLGATAGSITRVKPYAPNHLVYLGVVTTANPGAAGRMYVRVQNGYELDELHNVQAQSPTVNDVLYYFGGSPGQWKTASLATILGYTPLSQTLANTNIFVGNASNVATAVAMSGDATVANTGALTIANNAVTYAKMQNVSATSKLLGSSSTTTPVQEITIGSGLTLTGTTLTASGGTIGFKVPTITEVMSTTLALTNSIEYVASVDKLYVANGNNNVNIFNATTGELLSTVLLTQAFRVRYISSINEIWATSVNVASITRISPTTNASLGTITIGIEANGYDILEISSTKVYVSINTNGAQKIQIINPTTLAWVSNITVSITNFASGMALNSNPSSAQNGIVILGTSGAGSVNLINSTTNLVIATVTPGGISSSFEIAYSAADDKYYIASQGNGRIISLNITGLTTLTLDKIKYNAFLTISLQIDDTNDLLIINQVANSSSNLANMCHFIKKSTFESLYNIITPAAGGSGSRAGSVKLDLPNKRVFLTGRSASSLPVVTLKY